MIDHHQRQWSVIRVALLSSLLLVCCLGGPGPSVEAQTRSAHPPLVAVVHIDLDSTKVPRGVQILGQYADDCRKDPGNLSFMLLQEISRDNHLTVVETWRDQTAFQRHADSPYAKRFRNAIQPLLGSPFDERLHYALHP